MGNSLGDRLVKAAAVVSAFGLLTSVGFSGAVYLKTGADAVVVPPGGVAAADTPPAVPGGEIPAPAAPQDANVQYGATPALSNADFFAKVKDKLVSEQQSFIEADLTAMTLSVYQNGAVVKEVPIITKGRPGSWWETPAGLYQIQSKEKNHFSSFGHVYQPWSMAFQGNFFIHGWPYEPDGTPVASTYSGGCVRLSTDDAKAVYDLVTVGTPVLVYEQEFANDGFAYPTSTAADAAAVAAIAASTTAKEYLVADLKDNHVFFAQGSQAQVPIASITKLMTALVAAEYINLDASIVVADSAIVPTSKPRLHAGDQVSAYQLLYPLLDESSNEAAFALADFVGRARFVSLMNQKAAALGMADTRFTDPAGREDGNVSTAEDLFLLAKYLLNNRSFVLKISAGTLGENAYGAPQFAGLENFNVFAGQPDFLGGKVGETTAAGQTIISLFNETLAGQTRPVVVVALGSTDNAADARLLIGGVRAAAPVPPTP